MITDAGDSAPGRQVIWAGLEQGYLPHKKLRPLELYSRTMPRALRRPLGEALFLMGEVSL
jgi:hypothetical protein